MKCAECDLPARGKLGLCKRHYRLAAYQANKAYVLAQSKRWYEANKERKRKTRAAYYQLNKPLWLEKSKQRYLANKAEILEMQKQRKIANPERWKEIMRKSFLKNPHKSRARVRAYQLAKQRATPAWANLFFIEEIYHLADLRTKALGIPHEVDHIVPINSPVVCGLHVEHNLQVISRDKNVAKSNNFDVEAEWSAVL